MVFVHLDSVRVHDGHIVGVLGEWRLLGVDAHPTETIDEDDGVKSVEGYEKNEGVPRLYRRCSACSVGGVLAADVGDVQ